MKNKIDYILLALSVMLATVTVACQGVGANDDEYVVVIVTDQATTFADEIARFKSSMQNLGYIEEENITYLTLSLDNILTDERYLTRDFDAYYLANPAQLSNLLESKDDDIPIVTHTITPDSPALNQITSFEEPNGQFTGTIAVSSQEATIAALRELFPEVETVYMPIEERSIDGTAAFTEIEAILKAQGFEVRIQSLAVSPDLPDAIRDLPEDIDAIAIAPSRHDGEPICPLWMDAAEQRGIPFVLLGRSNASWCVPTFAMVGAPREPGSNPGALQMDLVLQGTPISEIPIEVHQFERLLIHQTRLDAAGLEIDASFYERDDVIIRRERADE